MSGPPVLRLNLSLTRRGALRHVREVLLLVGAYFAYMFVRRVMLPSVEVEALANAIRVVSFESAVGFLWEPVLQEAAIKSSKSLVIALNWAYILTFLPMILTTAVIVYSRDRPRYYYYRNLVLLSFIFALIVYAAFPLAPPRFVPHYGFVDAIQRFGPTWYGSREVDFYYNAFAAMPSLHFGWTVLFGILFFRTKTNRRWLKLLGVAYPTVTFFAIIITGNHFIVDAMGGGAIILASYLLYEGFGRWKRRGQDRSDASKTGALTFMRRSPRAHSVTGRTPGPR